MAERTRVFRAFLTGALFAAISALVFLIDVAPLRPYLPIIRMFVIALWGIRFWNSRD